MTGSPIPVSAQWALHGKRSDGDGYRILACSNGDLSKANFADAVGRFSMGVLDTLPQVSVSYLQPATRSPGGGYLALAIDWFATDGQHYANGALPRDELGRKTAFTSYFCTPYRPLAGQGATYQDMYRAFSAVTLPVADGPPQPVTIRTSAQTPAIDELAMYVASLLLTGTPVCVLDAEAITMEDRLRFIDTVMSLLPYGFRARMTAATWTRATYQSHRFRLYFSTAPRTDQKDHVVHWGAPDQVRLPRGQAKDYFAWLADKVNPLAGLAQLSELGIDLKFDNTALTKALELVDSLQGRRRSGPFGRFMSPQSSQPHGDVSALPAAEAASPPPPAPPEPDEIADTLRDCAEYIDGHNTVRLKSAISWLARQAKADSLLKQQAATDPALKVLAEAMDDRRKRYRAQIREYRLLQPHGLGSRDKDLYAALLEVAFGRPLTYTGYCRVEDCVDGGPGGHPHPALLNVIKDGDMAFETKAIVLYLTRQERNEKELNKWYGSGELDPLVLVHWLAQSWSRPHHARVVCDLTLDFLHKAPTRYDQESLRAVLHQYGYLAYALHMRYPDKDQYQISVLTRLLRAAYPGGLNTQVIGQILAGTSNPPTPALLAAVLTDVPGKDEIQFAMEAYIHGSLTLMHMHPDTYDKLRARIPALDSTAYTGSEPAPRPQAGRDTATEPFDVEKS